jgi:hypothetical protein
MSPPRPRRDPVQRVERRSSYEASPGRNERVLFVLSVSVLFVAGVVVALVLALR